MQSLVNRRKVRMLRKMRFWNRRKAHLSRPRLCVFRSSVHIQAQVIDDLTMKVLVSASSAEKAMKVTGLRGKSMAEKIGELVAERAKLAGVSEVVFDRNGYVYHGRVKVLADSARKAGLVF